jgi:hypothetical protein
MLTILQRIFARLGAAPVLRWEVRDGVHRGVAQAASVEIRRADVSDPFRHDVWVTATDGRHWSLQCRAPIEDARDLAERLVRERILGDGSDPGQSRAA